MLCLGAGKCLIDDVSNGLIMQAVASREAQDVALLEEKLNRTFSREECSRIGISRLREFLEQLLQRRYLL